MNDPAINNTLTLESVQEQFEAWRNSRTKREPIPETLWEAAIKLCLVHPRTHVCRILRLSFPDLKRRLSTAKTTPVRFTELDLSCFTGPWQIECERPDGARFRFSGQGQPPALESLLREFWS